MRVNKKNNLETHFKDVPIDKSVDDRRDTKRTEVYAILSYYETAETFPY
jgi:ribosomal protein S15P/S13E